jgi:tannase
MRQSSIAAIAALLAAATATNSTSLSDLCTVSNVQAALPAKSTLLGIELIPSASIASVVYNASSSAIGGSASSPTFTYCNVTITYTHTGKGDSVVVQYAFPSPDAFESQFYVAGGGGFSTSSDSTGGIQYGAVGGATSAGYDALNGVSSTRSTCTETEQSIGIRPICLDTRLWVR